MKKNIGVLLRTFYKTKYLIEFITMLFFSINFFELIMTKRYDGYWSKRLLIYIIITGVIFTFILVFNCIKEKNKIEKMFLNFVIPIGILYITFMLPTYTPDACPHIWKAYEISEGKFFTEFDENGESKTNIPEVLSIYKETVLTKYNVLEEAYYNNDSHNYNKTVQVDSPAKGYLFIFYLGYSIAFFVARTFGLNIFFAIYFAKITNFIVFLFLAYWSIKKIPFGKILLSVYFMIPMMMHQATAVSVDSIMNAIIILFISYTLFLAFKKEGLKKKEKIIYLILTALIGVVKVPYIPLIAISFIITKRRKELSKKEKIVFGMLVISICLGTFLIFSKINSQYTNQYYQSFLEENGVNSKEQKYAIITNPIKYLGTLYNNFIVNSDYYLFSSIGDYMGWLSIKAPAYYSICYIILLILSAFAENNKEVLKIDEKIGIISLTIIMYVLVITGLYLEWTKVGANVVAGVQGRYFLPIAILPLLALCKKNNYIKIKNINIIIPLCAFLINILFIKNMILFFI